ncbi:MAG: aldehyde dehydrogenase family protein, partial [Candidatus Dormibacteraceae bacterium]
MQPEWEELSLPERCGRVRSFNELARSNSEDIAHLIALETGRPITSARVIVAWGIQYFEAYLEMADKYLSPQITFQTASEIHRIYREPWGVVGCITPWNFPFLNVPWQCGQALIAGNTIVYKNSEKDPLFGQLLADLIDRSDLPSGVFNVLHGDGQVGRWILESDIDLISFTGSTKTGQEVAKLAAKKFIPYVAELG